MRRSLLLLLGCAWLGVAWPDALPPPPSLIAGVFTPPRLAPDFTLQGSNGRALRMQDLRGKLVLLAFGYAHCTAVCPLTLSVLADARRRLGDRAADVQVVYVTVDPERDDVEHMRKFVGRFDPSYIGATGTAAELAAVRRDYGISLGAKLPTGDGYSLNHSSFIYLIDKQGRLRALMPFGHSGEDFAHDLRILEQE
jgi:protein SCO1